MLVVVVWNQARRRGTVWWRHVYSTSNASSRTPRLWGGLAEVCLLLVHAWVAHYFHQYTLFRELLTENPQINNFKLMARCQTPTMRMVMRETTWAYARYGFST